MSKEKWIQLLAFIVWLALAAGVITVIIALTGCQTHKVWKSTVTKDVKNKIEITETMYSESTGVLNWSDGKTFNFSINGASIGK